MNRYTLFFSRFSVKKKKGEERNSIGLVNEVVEKNFIVFYYLHDLRISRISKTPIFQIHMILSVLD